MHIRELFPDVISEDLDYEYKTVLNPDKPMLVVRLPGLWLCCL